MNISLEILVVIIFISVFIIIIFDNLYKQKIYTDLVSKMKFPKFRLKYFKIEVLNIFILFLIHFIFQSYYYKYESINWDISSYLVASSDILRLNVPYEYQWESKQPFFYILYSAIIILSNRNLIFFKILSDLYLFAIIVILYFTLRKLSNKYLAFYGSLFYVVFMSQPWTSAEFSETYSLLFVGISYLIFLNSKNYFLIGALVGLSGLINIGSSIFLLPYLLPLSLKIADTSSRNKLYKLLSSFASPHIIVITFYTLRGSLNLYFETVFGIPASYSNQNFEFLNQVTVFLRSMFLYKSTLFILIIYILSSMFLTFILERNKKVFQNFERILFFLSSILFYYLAAHGYYHHLLFAIYFLTVLVTYFYNNSTRLIFYIFTIFLSSSVLTETYRTSFQVLTNLNEIYESYPLKKVSELIESRFDSEFSVLALDGVLTLYYLDKPNFSYIIHPSNHSEEFITEGLIDLGKIRKMEVPKLVDEEPDVILCSNNDLINCEIYDYKQNYEEIDVLSTRQNPYLQFYDNQSFNLRLFIKNGGNK